MYCRWWATLHLSAAGRRGEVGKIGELMALLIIPGVKAGRAAVVPHRPGHPCPIIHHHHRPKGGIGCLLSVAVPSDADAVPRHKPTSRFLLSLTVKRLICCPFTSIRRASADLARF